MRILWRSTAHIFWQYPSLWLPVVLADLIAVLPQVASRVDNACSHQQSARRTLRPQRRSGTAPNTPRGLGAVFGVSKLLVEFLNICLYATAMVAISTSFQH